ncbi:MAG: variable surface family protein [Armatimonadota bacterium]
MSTEKADNIKLEDFCRSAFELLDVAVNIDSGIWELSLPQSRMDLFTGRPTLRIAFDSEYAADGVDLVAPGSYVLDRLIEVVRDKGEIAHLSPMPSVIPSPLPHVTIRNGSTRLISSDTVFHPLLAMNYRISLVSDEDKELLFQAVINLENGTTVYPDLDALLLASTKTDDVPFALNQESLEAGFKAGRLLAEENAKRWASTMQRQIDASLDVEIKRLDGYYNELAESNSRTGNGDIRKLQAHRDKASEAYNQVSADYQAARELLAAAKTSADVGFLILERKEALRKRRKSLSPFKVDYYETLSLIERETKAFEKLIPVIKKISELTTIEERLAEFDRIRDKNLEAVRKKWETSENEKFDPDYLKKINEELNSEKSRRITELQEKCKLRVRIEPFSAAIIRYPYLECRFEAIGGNVSIPFSTVYDLITGKVDAPACRSCISALSDACVCSCGHLTCPSCTRLCTDCGKSICVSCVTTSCQICGKTLCEDCAHTCMVCGKVVCAAHTTRCNTCGQLICKGDEHTDCENTCAICGGSFCPAHSQKCASCRSVVCTDDIRTCSKCGAKACTIDIQDCPACGTAVCREHGVECLLCGQVMCGECINKFRYCDTCASLFPAESSISAIECLIAEFTGDNRLAHGEWFIGENTRRFVMVNMRGSIDVYVVDKSPCRLHSKRTFGFLDSICEKKRIHDGF